MLNIDFIKQCCEAVAKDYGAREVHLFGSYARKEAHPNSDVDILLNKGLIKGMQVLEFQKELSNLLKRKVDVVTTAGASDRLLNKIKKDVILLYKDDDWLERE